jgi:hypothetical protein
MHITVSPVTPGHAYPVGQRCGAMAAASFIPTEPRGVGSELRRRGRRTALPLKRPGTMAVHIYHQQGLVSPAAGEVGGLLAEEVPDQRPLGDAARVGAGDVLEEGEEEILRVAVLGDGSLFQVVPDLEPPVHVVREAEEPLGCFPLLSPLFLLPHLPPKRKTALQACLADSKASRLLRWSVSCCLAVRLCCYIVSRTRFSRKPNGDCGKSAEVCASEGRVRARFRRRSLRPSVRILTNSAPERLREFLGDRIGDDDRRQHAAPAYGIPPPRDLRYNARKTLRRGNFMDRSAHRPQGYQGQGDSRLPRVVRQLRRTLSDVQGGFARDIRPSRWREGCRR